MQSNNTTAPGNAGNEPPKLELTSRLSLAAIVAAAPEPVQAILAIGDAFARSGMFGIERPQAGVVIALTCVTEGLTPQEYLRIYHPPTGGQAPTKRAGAVFAEFRAKGGKLEWVNNGDDGKEATCQVTFEGRTTTHRYGIEQATKAGLVKKGSAWDTRPGNMLRARCITNAIGELAPEIFAGEYDGEMFVPTAEALTLAAKELEGTPAAAAPAQPGDPGAAAVTTAAPAKRGPGRPPKNATPAPAPETPPAPAPETPPAATPAIGTLVSGGPENIRPADPARLFPPSETGIAQAPAIHPSAKPAPASPSTASSAPSPAANAAGAAPAGSGTTQPPPPAPAQAEAELPNELQTQLLAIIGPTPEAMAKATAWLVSKGWLAPNTPLNYLPVASANKILAKADRFKAAAGLA